MAEKGGLHTNHCLLLLQHTPPKPIPEASVAPNQEVGKWGNIMEVSGVALLACQEAAPRVHFVVHDGCDRQVYAFGGVQGMLQPGEHSM